MKDRLIKGFGFIMFYALAMSCCIFVGAMVYLTASNLLPVPAGLPTALPTKGPSPTPTPTISPTPTPTPTLAPLSIEIRNRTDDETIGERLTALLSDGGYNVVKVSTGSTKKGFGCPFLSFRLWARELTGPEFPFARDICRFLEIDCQLWAGYTGDADVMIEIGSIHDWDEWLSER